MKKAVKSIIILAFFVSGFFAGPASARDPLLNAYFFYGDGCPHCAQEEVLLDYLENQYENLVIHRFEIYHNQKNAALLQKVATALGERVEGVPFLVVGDKAISGFVDGIISEDIIQRVEQCTAARCPDTVAAIVGVETGSGSTSTVQDNTNNQEVGAQTKVINLPLVGEVDMLKFSLPVLTIIMGILDGFNPCAMWTLLFLISLLLGVKDRKRKWILGSAFIVASAAVYFLFMAAWLNLILFLGLVIWIRIAIGLLALFGGGYSLKEYFVNKNATCKVVGVEKKKKTLERMKALVQENSFWLALGGIIVLAFAANLVELICSAGLPAVYTQVLAMNDLSGISYYLYILGYIFFFMLDDLFVFFVAMITLEVTGVTAKYTRASHLVGGIIMLLIGLLLIFKPELLMFK